MKMRNYSMKNFAQYLFLAVVITTFQDCKSQVSETENELYIYKSGDRNGIGKWYMGREIAHIMGYQGMSWLERSDREEEEQTRLLIKNMEIKNSDTIADIGAGSGYHVFKMAPMASEGLIYAVDIQQEMLNAIDKKKASNSVNNIELIKGSDKSVELPKNSVDKILMVDVYHEFSFPYEMLQSIKSALKKNGKLFLIEYRAEDPSVPIKRLHKMSENQAVKEFEAAGFRLERNIDNLPIQHCMVFVKH